MDYSTLPSDPEHPAGSSPWASSPQHHRTSFSQSHNAEVPPSPLPPAQSPYSGQFAREPNSLDNGDQPISQDTHANSTPANGTTVVSQNNFPQNDVHHEAQAGLASQPNAYSQRQSQQQEPQDSSRTEPQRYRQPKPNLRPTAQQGKLQAKITGLERTGRKDPILRFDVHVCFDQALLV